MLRGYVRIERRWQAGDTVSLDLPMPEGYIRHVSIHKLHIEEDAGKTKNDHGQRMIDFIWLDLLRLWRKLHG